jgi:signal transduction histidine kinase
VKPATISQAGLPSGSPPALVHFLWRDPVLRSAFLIVGGLIAFLLTIILLQPPWTSSVTDWLRALLAWPELLVVVLVSWWLTRARQPEARSGWLLSVALIFYAIARTMWSFEDRFIYLNAVPFPSLPDLFFLLQYPFFFLALALLPGAPPWERRARVILDCLLIMGAAIALSWYFLLAPIYLQSGESLLGKIVNLDYPLWDLGLLFGLTIALIYRRCRVERTVLGLLIIAVICLVTADTWASWLLLYPSHIYQTGHPSDLFWSVFYLLVPLALLVKLRVSQNLLARAGAPPTHAEDRQQVRRADLIEALRFLSPLLGVLLASALIAIRAIIAPLHPIHPMIPSLVIVGLLALALVRQGTMVLENGSLRRAWEQARTQELAAHASEAGLREANRQLETFLGMASHELKTPLTSILMSQEMLQRRLQRLARSLVEAPEDAARQVMSLQALADITLQQGGRLNRLINDMLDTSRIRAGRFTLYIRQADLAAIVHSTVEEQRQATPERLIHLHLPGSGPILVQADAERLRQVVSNYLTNALKYSQEDRPVEVGVEREDQRGRVWVRDQGLGIPPGEQEHLWDRFHRVPGIEVQSGSGIGLGIGLYISKTIIEQHGGQVGVQSTPGQGSTFWFTLPLEPLDQHPPDENG